MSGKLSEPHFDVLLFSNPGEKVWKAKKTVGQICHIVFLNFMTFSSRLETNDALQCSSDNFQHIVMYVLCVENCQNYLLTHSCLLIVGRPFYNVRKFHALRISECNIRFLPIFKVCIQYAKFPDWLVGCFAVKKYSYVCYGKKTKKGDDLMQNEIKRFN